MNIYLTKYIESKSWCDDAAANVNKDYPGSAEVVTKTDEEGIKKYAVVITENYYGYCLEYVRKHCKIAA